LLLAATLDSNAQSAPSPKSFPNVLFILSEDQGAHLSFLGTPGIQTPNIDSIAKSGVYFENAFVAYPVCSASKAALYTGLHSHTNGILNNTHNFHKPADQVTTGERNMRLARTNRIRDRYLTLTQILHANGYYQGVTHKLHVLPNEKFPYDEFLRGGKAEVQGFLNRAKAANQPWFLMVNIPYSHRPFPNSDKTPIRIQPSEVQVPKYLPDTPVVRKDWAEYFAGIEQVDHAVGETMDVLRRSGEQDQTIVVYMSDHGPTFQHGKMTLHDLGLRVPLAFSGPGIESAVRSEALVSELDLLPTLLDLVESQSARPLKLPGVVENAGDTDRPAISRLPYQLHGLSLQDLLQNRQGAAGHSLIFAEISNLGPLPNDGIQERSVFDGRWKLIYRENVQKAWRQVNADSRMFKKWGNRTYRETLRVKDRFPLQYRILAEQDPQELGAEVPAFELYDLALDPDELNNLAELDEYAETRLRLMNEIRQWAEDTADPALTFRSK
jgi:N-sulfoglucosamine sulfohydrolase